MCVSDLVNLHVRGKNIHDDRIAQRDYAGAELLSPNKFILLRIHRKEIALYSDERALVAFHRTNEMPPGVVWKSWR